MRRPINTQVGFIILLLASSIIFFQCNSQNRTPNGHAYQHHLKNTGNTPKEGDLIRYHYKQYKNNELVNTSQGHGAAPIERVVPRLSPDLYTHPTTEALLLMAAGDSLSLYIDTKKLPSLPSGYTSTDKMKIDFKMLAIISPKAQELEKDSLVEKGKRYSKILQRYQKEFVAGNLNDNLEILSDGIKMLVLAKGEDHKNTPVKIEYIDYIGQTKEGTEFANTFLTGEAIAFEHNKGKFIPAWEKVLPELYSGSKVVLFVPYQMAYGKAGNPPLNIGEETDLVFYIEK